MARVIALNPYLGRGLLLCTLLSSTVLVGCSDDSVLFPNCRSAQDCGGPAQPLPQPPLGPETPNNQSDKTSQEAQDVWTITLNQTNEVEDSVLGLIFGEEAATAFLSSASITGPVLNLKGQLSIKSKFVDVETQENWTEGTFKIWLEGSSPNQQGPNQRLEETFPNESFVVLKRSGQEDLLEGTFKSKDPARTVTFRISAKRAAVNHNEAALSLQKPWSGTMYLTPSSNSREIEIGTVSGATR